MALQQNVLSFPQEPPNNKSKAKRTPFTQTRVEALRHRGRGTEYIYDLGKPGLAVRLTSGGARTFVFVGRLHGKVQRITLGRVESLSLAKARAAVDNIRGDIALGIDVIAKRKALRASDANRKTLDEAFSDFTAGERHKKKTILDYRNIWALYVAGRLGRRSITDITVHDIKQVHAKVAAAVPARVKAKDRAMERTRAAGDVGVETLSPRVSEDWKGHRTANKVVALLRAVLTFAGRKADNPAAEVAWFRQSPRRRRLNDDEILRFRRAVASFDEAWRNFFTLSLLTGVRR